MAGGRPSLYTDEIIAQAKAYTSGGWENAGHAVPSIVGLCSVIGVGKSTVYDWADDPEKQFSDILENIKEEQELVTFNRSLTGDYNATIAKLLLGKHGYHDRSENTNKNIDVPHEDWLASLDE